MLMLVTAAEGQNTMTAEDQKVVMELSPVAAAAITEKKKKA